jgi:hypothetical protein
MAYRVSVRVDRQWLYVTGLDPITLVPAKDAYLFKSNKDAHECAERFNEAIVEVVQDSQS